MSLCESVNIFLAVLFIKSQVIVWLCLYVICLKEKYVQTNFVSFLFSYVVYVVFGGFFGVKEG